MSKKFEISGNDLVITDTVTSNIDYQGSASKVSFNNHQLGSNASIFIEIQDGSKNPKTSVFNCALAVAVNASLVSFTEATFRTFASLNFSTASGGSEALFNNVIINSISDFPAPIGGIIELVPNSGDKIVYEIGALDIDVSPNVFSITEGEIVIRGSHRTASGLTTDSSNTFFTSVDSALFFEFVGVTCPSAQVWDYSNPSAGFNSFVNQNLIIRDCDSIGTIEDAFVASFRTFTVVDTQSGGLTMIGTGGNQLNMSTCLGLSWTGTLIDLGTAKFNIIDIAANNRFISPVGTTILSGLTANGNLNVDGRGLVEGNIFGGDGTALSGIDSQDLQWSYQNNVFVDGVTMNTRTVADAFLTTAEEVTITTQGVFEPIDGVNWSSDLSDRFTVSTAGLMTFIGLDQTDVTAAATATVEKVGGGTDQICMKIAINGTVQDKTLSCTENSSPTGLTSIGVFTLMNLDTVQLYVANMDSDSNINVTVSSVMVRD